jgi:hypothetical protein
MSEYEDLLSPIVQDALQEPQAFMTVLPAAAMIAALQP